MRKANRHMKRRPVSHILLPNQVDNLLMPIHVAAMLLPMGAFQKQHGHDLAAFLNVMQFATREAGRNDLHDIASGGAEVILAAHERVKRGEPWAVTDDERKRLMDCITSMDAWCRRQPADRIQRALHTVLRMCDRAEAQGREEMEVLEDVCA